MRKLRKRYKSLDFQRCRNPPSLLLNSHSYAASHREIPGMLLMPMFSAGPLQDSGFAVGLSALGLSDHLSDPELLATEKSHGPSKAVQTPCPPIVREFCKP